MKLNIDYYPHRSDAHRHPKFKMLRSLFGSTAEGWAAEGRFWALNNLIASSENCRLDLRKKRNKGVFADELGMSISEFDEFIAVLKSEDVELIVEIEENIFTTETVIETYSSVAAEREKARRKKSKSDKNTSSPEKLKSSPELSESSPELNNKGKGRERNGMEWNRKEGKEKDSSLSFIKNLFLSYTKIQDPSEAKQIEPIQKFLTNVPESMTMDDVQDCIVEEFKKLPKDKGVNIDFLCSDIQRSITAKHESILQKKKQKALKQAQKDRKNEASADDMPLDLALLDGYKNFFQRNKEFFTPLEIMQIESSFAENKVLRVAPIIEEKMEQIKLPP